MSVLPARRAAVLLAAAYLAGHLPFLAPSLEDIDSINFALGLRDFDVAAHQPHPPGSPLYIALGRVSLAVVGALAPALEPVRAEALALAFWSALAGAVALVAAARLFHALGAGAPAGAPAARWSVAILAVSPLFWLSGLRPMSDLPALALALVAQALVAAGDRRALVIGAAVAGLSAGIKLQALWLTAPLLLWALGRERRAGVWWLVSRPLAALAAGGLVWAVPLVAVAGGPAAYLAALGSQAGEDFAWVDMLWSNPTPRRLAFSLWETLVLPWQAPPLAGAVLVTAAIGLVIALRRDARALGILSLAFGPYAVLHLLFQETVTVRYALPLVVPVAWLAARALAALGPRAWIPAVPLVAVCAVLSGSSALAYAAEPHPAFRAIADMARAAGERPQAIFAHYSLRRPLQAQPPSGVTLVEPPRTREWAGMLEYWRAGGDAPVWFLADPKRTDLALIDPAARTRVARYAWAVADLPMLGGTRPLGVEWYRLHDPGWFAGEGWSLTPELGGMVRAAGTGVDRAPIEAYVRRRPDAMVVVVGTRHLGPAEAGAARFTLEIDGRVVDQWRLDPGRGANVVRLLTLPPGRLDGQGRYARLRITARADEAGAPTPPVAVRQFDIQPESGLVFAFDEGWHEAEYDNATGVSWRWSSGRSLIRVAPPQAIRLTLRGESPLLYRDAPPTVRVLAGDEVLAAFTPDDDFEWAVMVPGEALRRAGGAVIVETSPVYLPGPAEGTADSRELGLRLFAIGVDPVRP